MEDNGPLVISRACMVKRIGSNKNLEISAAAQASGRTVESFSMVIVARYRTDWSFCSSMKVFAFGTTLVATC